MPYDSVAIAGYGETDYHKTAEEQKSPYEYIAEATKKALNDGGFSKNDIDGMVVVAHELSRENEITLAQHFGISGRWFQGGSTGNAAPIVGMLRATQMIASGKVDTIVIAAGGASTPDINMDLLDEFNHGVYNYMRPFGFGGANGLFALLQSRHMHEYGTTREQLSNISVTQREHAAMNPTAIFRETLSETDYLEARPIVEPIHLYDCVLPCGGGGAIILTSRDNLSSTDAGVYIHRGDEYHNPSPSEFFDLETGFSKMDIFDSSVGREDIDALQIYDNYPIYVLMQLEDLGFCEKGDGGRFIEQTDLSIGGDLPLNTGGGQLSVGQAQGAGGILHSIEAIRQLRGEGEERQLDNPEYILATGPGTIEYGGTLCHSAIIFSKYPHKEEGS